MKFILNSIQTFQSIQREVFSHNFVPIVFQTLMISFCSLLNERLELDGIIHFLGFVLVLCSYQDQTCEDLPSFCCFLSRSDSRYFLWKKLAHVFPSQKNYGVANESFLNNNGLNLEAAAFLFSTFSFDRNIMTTFSIASPFAFVK